MTYEYPSLQNVNVNKIYGTMAGSLVDFTSATVPPSVITGLQPVATGGSIANSLVTGLAGVITGYGYATTGYVTSSISSAVSTLASTSYVDIAVSSLASTSYVDIAVSSLASTSYVGSTVSSAVSGLASEIYVDTAVNGLASEIYVDTAVNGLASEIYVDTAVSSLASTSYVNSAVSGLASSSSVTTALNDYTTTANLDPVATGGTLDATRINVGVNNYIQGSQLQPSSITPGTFYICTGAPGNFAVNKKIEGSTNPLLMAKAIAQCVKFANDAAEYYNAVNDAPCTTVVSDSPTAYILCLETIVGVSSILYTDHTPS